MKTRSSEFIDGGKIAWESVGDGVERKIMGYDGQIMMVKVKFKTGAVGAKHTHYHSQVSNIESGKFEVTIGDKTSILSAGDGFYAEPDAEHGVVCLEEGVILDVFSPMRADFLKK